LVLVAAGGLQQIAIERRAKLDELERIHRTGCRGGFVQTIVLVVVVVLVLGAFLCDLARS
jgi:hypothetical protein